MHYALFAGYRRLWMHVVLQALRDANSPQELIHAPAQAWLEDRSTDVGSLAWICELFDVDFERVQRRVTTEAGRRQMMYSSWETDCES